MASIGGKLTVLRIYRSHTNTGNIGKTVFFTAPAGGETVVKFGLLDIDDLGFSVHLRTFAPDQDQLSSSTDKRFMSYESRNLYSNFEMRMQSLRINTNFGGEPLSSSQRYKEGDIEIRMNAGEQLIYNTFYIDNSSNRLKFTMFAYTQS